jgi:DNA-binding transcriptional LysR family regulator
MPRIIRPDVELRQLRAFLVVATVGHFGQAAEQLNLTQPALTQRIQALERELGVRLFERSAREVRLTTAGQLLLPHAQKLLEIDDEALRELKDYRAGTTGQIRIAYHTAGDSALTGSIIAEFRRRFPAVDIQTSPGSSGANLQRLRGHNADAALALMPATRPAGIAARTIRHEEIILALAADHHLAQMGVVPVAALRGEGLGLPPAAVNPDLLTALVGWLELRTGDRLNVVSEDPSDLAIETLARSGRAAVVVVRRYTTAAPAQGLTYRSMSPAPFVDLVVAYRDDDASPTLANLLRVVGDVAATENLTLPEGAELI